MKDVAKAAGVSQAAVSYAYSRPNKVSKEQREHVLKIAHELGYAGPNVFGQSLRRGRVGAIGVIVPDSLAYTFEDPSAFLILKGISETGDLANVPLTVLPIAHAHQGQSIEVSSFAGQPLPETSPALRGLVDGLVVFALSDDDPVVAELARRGTPLVTIDSPIIEGVPYITVDDRGGMRSLFSHVIEVATSDILIAIDKLSPNYPSGPVSLTEVFEQSYRVPRERLLGIRDAALSAGYDLSKATFFNIGSFHASDAADAFDGLLSKHCPSAIVGINDVVALAAIESLQRVGQSVPGGVAVAGFDGSAAAEAAQLTTVRQPMAEKGRLSARMLLEILDGKETFSRELPVELLIRDSTRLARAD
ncbi:LacI family DNA-binding transcriptional regulator [Cucumibacter marinus]|uniref:LacI family DNA-binding transcriptional regulator n=1 Tax=Cucumibacter marinus TaxID=1121252 RepID=UPI00041E5F99|nr:LacI family DNA-binding transcriptional regulator [Cucumibacter marinus]